MQASEEVRLQIRELRDTGMSLREIVAWLNANEVEGGPWRQRDVSKLLERTYEEAFTVFQNEAHAVLDMRQVSEHFKHKVLSATVIWHPEGLFFGVRYTTAAAAAPDAKGKRKRDHVHTRHKLVQRILDGHDLREVFEQAGVICYVTAEEHSRLSKFDKTHDGWERYRAAGVEPLDRDTGSVCSGYGPEATNPQDVRSTGEDTG